MRPETIGKICELCGTPDDLQEEHGHDNAGETIGMLLEHHERYLGLTE